MGWLADLALGMLLVAFFTVECFSVWWTLNAGDPPVIKNTTWLGTLLYYNGLFIFLSLIGAGMLGVCYLVGRLALRG